MKLYTIYTGRKETLEKIKQYGIKGLNPKTMKYQYVAKDKQLEIKKITDILYELVSPTDIRKEAKLKGLIV